MAKIIVCEDNPYEGEILQDEIDLIIKPYSGWECKVVRKLYNLNALLEPNSNNLESEQICLVLDLNMAPSGLKDKIPAIEFRYTGWYWFKENYNLLSKYNIYILFYSAFSNELLESRHYSELEQYNVRREQFIEKGDLEELKEKLSGYLHKRGRRIKYE